MGEATAPATKLFPHAMLHWEDFGAGNARRILERYAGQCCTFNDDLQGAAATALAAVYTAMRVTRSQLCDQRVVIHGVGTAGLGKRSPGESLRGGRRRPEAGPKSPIVTV